MKKFFKSWRQSAPKSEPSSSSKPKFPPKANLAPPNSVTPEPVITTFTDLGLAEPLLRSLEQEGYAQPTPIQVAAIPPVIAARDLIGCAQTGTGKTAAFALPILHLLTTAKESGPGIKALVLTPTRELALQIQQNFAVYGRFTKMRSAVIFGGVGAEPQKKILRSHPDILIATPGRFLDLQSQGCIQLSKLKVFVLDEADRMLDMGFIHDVKRIIKLLPKPRQNLLFSATMPADIQSLALGFLVNPVKVAVAPVSSTAERVAQCVYYVERPQKRHLLLHLLATNKAATKVIVFTRTKAIANRVTEFLNKSKIKSEAIHGNKSQNARQRALANFSSGHTRVLVASDIAARGIDVEEISHVINYDVPNVPETYVHRIGRTGRADKSGEAISLCDPTERAFVKDIEKLIGKKIDVASNPSFIAPPTARK